MLGFKLDLYKDDDDDYDDHDGDDIGNEDKNYDDDVKSHRKDISWNPVVRPGCVLVLHHLSVFVKIFFIDWTIRQNFCHNHNLKEICTSRTTPARSLRLSLRCRSLKVRTVKFACTCKGES